VGGAVGWSEVHSPISLFGFEIGKKLASVEGFTFVQEEPDYFSYTRTSKNKEFLLQGIGISKLSRTARMLVGRAWSWA
jgi:hypothetical protein